MCRSRSFLREPIITLAPLGVEVENLTLTFRSLLYVSKSVGFERTWTTTLEVRVSKSNLDHYLRGPYFTCRSRELRPLPLTPLGPYFICRSRQVLREPGPLLTTSSLGPYFMCRSRQVLREPTVSKSVGFERTSCVEVGRF